MSKRKFSASGHSPATQPPARIRKMAPQPATTTVDLNSKESRLMCLLLDAAKYVDTLKQHEEPVVLRWAGGWVRDKLLGIESHDIDTAVNNMTGQAFATKLCEMCEQPDMVQKHEITQKDIGHLHNIARNPDKSKHLETTTIKLFGYDVDFVNLRKETYTEDSRNPQMEFGTAEEDASRRDATVNALFYNLNTAQVEDFTTGLQDMRATLIRTPMPPLETFTDDPLRILRLIRFASRLEFTIDPAAEQAMANPRVLQALRVKISRERVGIEIEKMLKGNHPRRSLQYIHDLGLYHTIFTDPTKADMPKPDISAWPRVYECLQTLKVTRTPHSIYDVLIRTDEASYYAWVLAALSPWESWEQPPHNGSGRPSPPMSTLAGREGIKAHNKLCDLVTAAHKNRSEIMSLKTAVVQDAAYTGERDRFGMAIRRWDERGGNWKLQVLSALLVEALQSWNINAFASDDNDTFLGGWQKFLDHLQELDVMDAPSLRRILNGTQLAKALGVKPGKWMMSALEVCTAWQLRHPEATDPTEAIEEVRRRRDELGIPKD
ncbi:hypothetical protein GGR56DRAFT_663178 [Xylariaceae sp. FL0804]|nr:hypothetical protein GGR56DRAFT_663178 [Xylariaceae sp. FL0804]